MTYGLTSSGFVLKPQPTIFEEMQADVWAGINDSLDLSSSNPMGQFLGVTSTQIAQAWEVLQALSGATNRGAAQGFLLDALGELIGRRREKASYSTVTESFTINSGVTVPQGFVLQVAGQPQNTWTLQTAVTNGTGTAGSFTGAFRATQAGPVAANAATLTVIPTPLAGFTGPTNAADATLGRLVETDAQYRLGQAQSEESTGSTTVDSLRSALYNLLAAQGVSGGSVQILENLTLSTDVNGQPGRSFQCIVYDGASPISNNLIAGVIWKNRPAGMQAYGSSSGTTVDAINVTRTVAFTRPTLVPIYVHLSIQKGPKYVGVSGGATEVLVKGKMVASASAAALVGTGASPAYLERYVLDAVADPNDPTVAQQAIADIGSLQISIDNSTFTSNLIPLTVFQLATFLSSNVTVSYV